MTNKTLSQQICEICGIEPKYQCSYHSCICPIQDIGKFNPKCPKQAVTKECDARSNKPCYIDFQNNNNNNNFVNLLELFHKNNFYINDISLNSAIEKESFVICFLKSLIKTLTDETISKKVKDVLKQAIKNEDWVV